MNRAYSVFTVKSVDDEKRVIEGIASTPATDRVGDIVEPKGAEFTLPIPFLWQHDRDQPIGEVFTARVTNDGITVKARVLKIDEPGTLKDRLDAAWQSIKHKLVKGLSIGFKPIEYSFLDDGGMRFAKWSWLELSAVTIAANADASITAIKAADDAHLAALGTDGTSQPAGASASREPTRSRKVSLSSVKKTISEQIKEFEATRETKRDRMTELMSKSADDGTTLDAAESEEYDRLDEEVKSVNEHIKRLQRLEEHNKAAAVEAKGETAESAAQSRGGQTHQITVSPVKLPPGIGLARAVKAFGVARMDGRNPLELAKQMYPSDTRLHAHVAFQQNLPNVISQIKATVVGATTTGTQWADALADPTNLAEEFIEYLRPATIIGRLNLRRLPFNVRVVAQTSGGTAYWVGEGAPKPLTEFRFSPITLGPTKVATIAVATEESVRLSTPSLDMIFRDALAEACIERIDRDLLDPAEAGSTNVQPASLTNGVVALGTAGTSADNARTDIGTLVRALRSANLRGPIVLVMPDSLVTALSLMANALGQPEFPGLNAEGGTISGFRVIGSEYVANASGFGNMVVAIAEREVFLADDGQVTIDLSREASLQMLDNPTNNSASGTATAMVSMWQTNSVAFRAERWINWLKRRADAVAWIDDVNWGSVGSPS